MIANGASPSLYSLHSPTRHLHFREISLNPLIQLHFLSHLLFEFGFEGVEAFGEVEVVFVVGEADVSSGGEDVVEGADFSRRYGFTKSLNIFIGGIA